MSSIMHLAKLAAAALLVCRLRCSGWRHGVGRLHRTPSHSRRAGARLLALGSDKAGAENTPRKPHAAIQSQFFRLLATIRHERRYQRRRLLLCPNYTTVTRNKFRPSIRLGAATKKNPRPFTRLGFQSCCLNSHRLLTGRRGVGGWGAALSAYSTENSNSPRKYNAAPHYIIVS